MRPADSQLWQHRRPLGSHETIFVLCVIAAGWFSLYLLRERYHFADGQLLEFAGYCLFAATGLCLSVHRLLTARSQREREWPHPPLVLSPRKDERATRRAWSERAVVLGYDVHGKPWLWPDRVRVMQGIVLGMTGTGKTTLLRSIITQDLYRVVGAPALPRRIPMVIFDGKGDMEFFHSLLPHIHRAGRIRDLRVLNPGQPDLSVRYNPLHSSDEDYMPVVNMVFGSFNLHDEFFAKHQLNYLADIVRVLVYTGLKFNFYDVLVMAIDEQVLREQVAMATRRLERSQGISTQRRLNFEMSVKNLYQSFE